MRRGCFLIRDNGKWVLLLNQYLKKLLGYRCTSLSLSDEAEGAFTDIHEFYEPESLRKSISGCS